MRDHCVFEPGDLSGLDFQTWLAQIDDAASDDVFVDYHGPKHATVLWEQSKTLIVTFEHHSDLSAYSSGVPIGWQLAQEKGWSHLCVASEHQDWFRDPHVIRHFDRLIDDGFWISLMMSSFPAATPGVMRPRPIASDIQWRRSSQSIRKPRETPASHPGTNGLNTHGDRISQHVSDMPQKCVKAPSMFLSSMTRTAPKMPFKQLCFRGTMSRICAAW